MKFSLTLFFISSITLSVFSQKYWQQEVNYNIKVKLDDENHTLKGFESFVYVNNSYDTLNFIYVHLWPNAYLNENTKLSKQLSEAGNDALRFSDTINRGKIYDLDFKLGNEKLTVIFEDAYPDICKLLLPYSLLPGERIEITTPFSVKIPSGEISRLGHIGQSYQITQWYPKPAVYDKNGWNQIPYLNQGEFYSEYGSFDVEITLPSNYVIAATGDLQTKSEIEFLNKKIETTKKHYAFNSFESNLNIESSKDFKTVRFTQSRVHDFAWFADKSYEVLKGEVILPNSKDTVDTWAMFTPKNSSVWKNSIEYINDGTYYYSLWNGDYPYSHVTAVDGTISAGGGMEYPNVTVIGNTSNQKDLEVVIVHEVGHNWFYGILGSNERVHGWMDEGLNTLNEMRYIQTKYPNNTYFSDMLLNNKFHFEDLDHHDNGDISFQLLALLGEDQPIETASEKFSPINYGIVMYQKTGLVFFYLKAYLGQEMFDKCMGTYFETWKFRHPQPEDLCNVFEAVSGKDLKWIFVDLIQTTNHIDYKLKSVRFKDDCVLIKVKNKGQIDGPIELNLFSNDILVYKKWVEPGLKINKIVLKDSLGIDLVVLDKDHNIPEINRSNNQWNKSWLFNKFEPMRFEFLSGDNDQNKTSNFWTPIIMGNKYDHTMVGMLFHNYTIPSNRFQYLIAPLYSFSKKGISGIGEFSYVFLPKNKFKMIRVGSSIKSFKNKDNFYNIGTSNYANISPYVYMKVGDRRDASKFDHSILVQGIYNNMFSSSSTISEEVGGFIKIKSRYRSSDAKADLILRNDLMSNITNNNQVGRFSIQGSYKYKYMKNSKKRWLEMNAYFGTNYTFNQKNSNSLRYRISLSGISGDQDIFYEDYYLARTSLVGSYSGQKSTGMGDFKTNSSINSKYWVSTFNTYLQLPINPNIMGVFTDLGCVAMDDKSIHLAFNTGLGFRVGEVFGLYFPLYNTVNLGNLYNDYLSSIRFTFKMNIVNIGFRIPNLY